MKCTIALISLVGAGSVSAAPTTYNIDPDHTHPSFEVDHFGVLSTWRGTFGKTSGAIVLDRAAQAGTVEVIVDTGSVDLANTKLNEHVASAEMLDSAKFPTAVYKGELLDFSNGSPTKVKGTLTLHGVTKPVMLTVNTFKCMPHPMLKKEVCGANASGVFNRAEFGINYGEQYGFNQNVALHIQVEGIKGS